MRIIPSTLQAHKETSATTLTKLLRFQSKSGKVIGFTMLDQSITYDDGRGPVTYLAPIGFQPATVYETLGLEVGNTEHEGLLVPEYEVQISEHEVNSGQWDYATFDLYEVNYSDLSQGHWVVQHGTVGEIESRDGLRLFGELRGLAAQLTKPIVEVDSRSCRAIFGSQPGDEGVRFPCGFNAESLWEEGEVSSVGIESFYTFSDDGYSLPDEDGFYVPGLVEFLTGDNAGRTMEVDSYDGATGTFTLRHPLAYAIQVGDTYRRRRDCSKFFDDNSKGCAFWFGNQRGLHFRGEPYIPVADIGSLTVPGAAVGPGWGGSTGSTVEIITGEEGEEGGEE